MPGQFQLQEISHVIQIAVAPVFLLAGVGAIINVLAGRLARTIDRARTLEARLPSALEDAPDILRELNILSRRARTITLALTLAVTCALLVSLLIALAFVDAFLPLNLALVVAVLFVCAMFCFSGSLLAFLHEIRLANTTLHFGIRKAEHAASGRK